MDGTMYKKLLDTRLSFFAVAFLFVLACGKKEPEVEQQVLSIDAANNLVGTNLRWKVAGMNETGLLEVTGDSGAVCLFGGIPGNVPNQPSEVQTTYLDGLANAYLGRFGLKKGFKGFSVGRAMTGKFVVGESDPSNSVKKIGWASMGVVKVQSGEFFICACGLVNKTDGGISDVKWMASSFDPTPFFREAAANKLGGGYKGAKWGMTKAEVKKVVGGKVNSGSKNTMEVSFANGASAKCFFFKDKFYRVEYSPSLHDNDPEGVAAILNALQEKYGPGQAIPNMADASMGFPLLVYEWRDAATTITFRMWDQKALQAGGYSSLASTYPSSTLGVMYASLVITNEKEQADKAEGDNASRSKIKKTAEKYGSDL